MDTFTLINLPLDRAYYSIKRVSELLPRDIILHPIYREDGLLLVSRYKLLSSLIIAQIRIHVKDDMPVLVANSQEQLKSFIDNMVFSSKEFIDDITTVIEISRENFKVPIKIESYVDERMNLKLSLNDKNQYSYEAYVKNELANSIWASPMWSSLGYRLESEVLKSRAENIKLKIAELLNNDKCMLDLLKQIKKYDEALFMHGVNILSISILIGLTLELSDDDLLKLAVGALFCNVGYLKVDKNTYHEFLKHKEYDESIKNHVRNSLELLTKCPYCRSKDVIYGILDHHEYYNGSGFPAGKKRNEITIFGRILAIATSYEDLVGSYFHEDGITSNDAINIIWENKDMKFDPHILSVYMFRSNIYKIGQTVIFGKYGKGEILGFSNFAEAPHKPIIRFENGYIKNFYEDIEWSR